MLVDKQLATWCGSGLQSRVLFRARVFLCMCIELGVSLTLQPHPGIRGPLNNVYVCLCVCTLQLAQLFPNPQEWDSIQTLMSATRLLKGVADNSSSSSGSGGAGDGTWSSESAAESAAWALFYSHRDAAVCLMVLSCWLPEALAAGFLRSHLVSHGYTLSVSFTIRHLRQWNVACKLGNCCASQICPSVVDCALSGAACQPQHDNTMLCEPAAVKCCIFNSGTGCTRPECR
jgi:hypothetical protein